MTANIHQGDDGTVLSDGYYAVTDPTDPAVMTYWRIKGDRVTPWPARARYGPLFLRRDAPPKSNRPAYIAHFEECSARLTEWAQARWAALVAEPVAARARFAALTTRCCVCSRALTDPATKLDGIGPECRSGIPVEVLDALAADVARAHAAATNGTVPA